MFASLSQSWKLALTILLMLAIFGSVLLRAPRTPVARLELQYLLGAAILLYAIGAVASLSHRAVLAGIVYAFGILVCSLAVWLSRGSNRGRGFEGGEDGSPVHDPPPGGDGVPPIDWDAFERELAELSRREPVGR